MPKKIATLMDINIPLNSTLKIGLYLDGDSDVQLPEGFNVDWEGLPNSEVLKKLSVIVVSPITHGAFLTGHSSEGEPFRILVSNQTGEDQSGILIQISER